ncbi:MAG: hypothetical protein ACOY2B_06890 [Pseudomonadota bacterium]
MIEADCTLIWESQPVDKAAAIHLAAAFLYRAGPGIAPGRMHPVLERFIVYPNRKGIPKSFDL